MSISTYISFITINSFCDTLHKNVQFIFSRMEKLSQTEFFVIFFPSVIYILKEKLAFFKI